MNIKKGKLIAFEGPDASGKTTQVNILKERLSKEGKPVEIFKFPTHNTYYGRLLIRYLNGEFGNVEDVNPYLTGVLYALDRLEMRDKINAALNKGKLVLLDRYVASNKAHMGAKIKDSKKREQFINWVDELDFKKNKLPKDNLTIFLDVPVVNTLELMSTRKKNKDIHEKDINYMKDVWEVYNELANSENWIKIKCVNNGKMLSKEKVAEEIYNKVKDKLNI